MTALEVILFIVLPLVGVFFGACFLAGFIVFRLMFFSQNRKVVERSTNGESRLRNNADAHLALEEFDAAKRLFFSGEIFGSVLNLPDFMWAKKPQKISVDYQNGEKLATSYAHFYAAKDFEQRSDYAKESGLGSEFSSCMDYDKWVILVHGHGGSGRDNYKLSYQFMKRGYNVIAIDLKGHGCDDSNIIDYGYSDRLAIKAWAERVYANNKNARLVLYGVSMGASACFYALGEELPACVSAAICDSGFSYLYDVCLGQVKSRVPFLPSKLVLKFCDIFVKKRLSFSLKKLNVIDAIKGRDSLQKVLIFHGLLDKLVDVKSASLIYEALGASKNGNLLKIYNNAGHIESMPLNFEDYFYNVDEFLKGV